MAQQYRCDVCEETTADFMITNIADGRVVAVGIECLLDWALPQAEAYRELVDRHQAAQAAQDGPGPVPAAVAAAAPLEGRSGAQAGSGGVDPEWEQGYPQGGRPDGPEVETDGPHREGPAGEEMAAADEQE